ncbi:hypothetical protein H9P43_008986 [Blastocladiella emersonii ATCC 22665]|nr:hypothetical protein H9P43_008986 [Blastocladiella emersonii ATCC 22665]
MPRRTPLNTGLPAEGAQRLSRVRAALVALHESYPDLVFDVTTDGSLLVESRADGERPMECPFPGCRQRFKRRRANDVARHFQTKHAPDALPFVCPAPCTMRTNRRDHFAKHLELKESCVWRLLSQRNDPDVDIMMTMAAQSGAFGAAGHWTALLAAAHEFDLADIHAAPAPPSTAAHGFAPAFNDNGSSTLLIPSAATAYAPAALAWPPPPPPPGYGNLPLQLHASDNVYGPIAYRGNEGDPGHLAGAAAPLLHHRPHHHQYGAAYMATAGGGRAPPHYPSEPAAPAPDPGPVVGLPMAPPPSLWDAAYVVPAPQYPSDPASALADHAYPSHPAPDAAAADYGAVGGWHEPSGRARGAAEILAAFAQLSRMQPQPRRAESATLARTGGPHVPHAAAVDGFVATAGATAGSAPTALHPHASSHSAPLDANFVGFPPDTLALGAYAQQQ